MYSSLRSLAQGALISIALVVLPCTAEQSPLKLWFDKPANQWEEALPLGNGRLGAMVHGGITQENLQ